MRHAALTPSNNSPRRHGATEKRTRQCIQPTYHRLRADVRSDLGPDLLGPSMTHDGLTCSLSGLKPGLLSHFDEETLRQGVRRRVLTN